MQRRQVLLATKNFTPTRLHIRFPMDQREMQRCIVGFHFCIDIDITAIELLHNLDDHGMTYTAGRRVLGITFTSIQPTAVRYYFI